MDNRDRDKVSKNIGSTSGDEVNRGTSKNIGSDKKGGMQSGPGRSSGSSGLGDADRGDLKKKSGSEEH